MDRYRYFFDLREISVQFKISNMISFQVNLALIHLQAKLIRVCDFLDLPNWQFASNPTTHGNEPNNSIQQQEPSYSIESDEAQFQMHFSCHSIKIIDKNHRLTITLASFQLNMHYMSLKQHFSSLTFNKLHTFFAFKIKLKPSVGTKYLLSSRPFVVRRSLSPEYIIAQPGM